MLPQFSPSFIHKRGLLGLRHSLPLFLFQRPGDCGEVLFNQIKALFLGLSGQICAQFLNDLRFHWATVRSHKRKDNAQGLNYRLYVAIGPLNGTGHKYKHDEICPAKWVTALYARELAAERH